jgi:hypothetical protein
MERLNIKDGGNRHICAAARVQNAQRSFLMRRNSVFVSGMFSMALIWGCILLGCPNDTTGPGSTRPEDKPAAERWSEWHDESITLDYTVAGDGLVTVTVGDTPDDQRWRGAVYYDYTSEEGKRYTYTFEAWTGSGERVIDVRYYAPPSGDNAYVRLGLSITASRQTFTYTGGPVPDDQHGLSFTCGDRDGTFYIKVISITPEPEPTPPETKPVAERWSEWHEESITLAYTVAGDGVVTVTVGSPPDDQRWRGAVYYDYTSEAGKTYDYTFEAWTGSGERTIDVRYYAAPSGETLFVVPALPITADRQPFTYTGGPIPALNDSRLSFACSDQAGTFYIKVLSIAETEE